MKYPAMVPELDPVPVSAKGTPTALQVKGPASCPAEPLRVFSTTPFLLGGLVALSYFFLNVILVVVGAPPSRPGVVASTTRLPPSSESTRFWSPAWVVVVMTSLLPSHVALETCSAPPRPGFLLSDPSSL